MTAKNCLGFHIIEDSRFPHRPKLEERVAIIKGVMIGLNLEHRIDEPYTLISGTGTGDTDDDHYQKRVQVLVYYNRNRKEIIQAVNRAIPAPPYKVNGRWI